MFRKKIFDPKLPYRCALYLRMSSDLQNKRSPDQQRQEIERRLKALGYSWTIVEVYRDEALSGRLLKGRGEYQRMMRDIFSGNVAIDLILVDCLERFGRVEELQTIRKKLLDRHGVLVLTSDSNFTDPTSPAGKALGMVEAMRSTEHGRILAHNVLRGKRDAAMLKHWVGGVPPFGYMLKSVMKTVDGREEVDYRIIVPNPRTSWIIELLFNKALETGWGVTRLAAFLTKHPDIPADLKPFLPASVGYWIDSQIYYGDLYFEKNSTGIVDDRRVVEANSPEDVFHVAEYCEGIVTRELWEQVQQLRNIRRKRVASTRSPNSTDAAKQITAPAPGMSIGYLLSGLVYCQECGLRMIATPSSGYTTKSGELRKYTAYVCAGYRAGHCANKTSVPEEWLRGVVIGAICKRLFSDGAIET